METGTTVTWEGGRDPSPVVDQSVVDRCSARSSARLLSIPRRAQDGWCRLDAYLEALDGRSSWTPQGSKTLVSRGRSPWLTGFYDRLGEEEQEAIGVLWAAMIELGRGRRVLAHRLARSVTKLAAALPEREEETDELAREVLQSFAIAMLRRIDCDSVQAGNLYLDSGSADGMLRAFELLRWRTPIIPFAYEAANRRLVSSLSVGQPLTVVDVGSGRSGQIQALLSDPWTRQRLSTLHVVAVEPDPSRVGGRSTLEHAREGVLEAARRAGVPTTFVGIAKRAEVLELRELREAVRPGRLVVNASLCLHHLGSEEVGAERNRALRLFRALGAETVVLVEPDSSHEADDLGKRLVYSYCHYRTVARALRSCLSAHDARLVWDKFFHREIQNIVAYEGRARSERHELGETWASRLRMAGWAPQAEPRVPTDCALPRGFTTQQRESMLSLCFGSVPLLSVLSADRM